MSAAGKALFIWSGIFFAPVVLEMLFLKRVGIFTRVLLGSGREIREGKARQLGYGALVTVVGVCGSLGLDALGTHYLWGLPAVALGLMTVRRALIKAPKPSNSAP